MQILTAEMLEYLQKCGESYANLARVLRELEAAKGEKQTAAAAKEAADIARFLLGRGDNLDFIARGVVDALDPETVEAMLQRRFPGYRPAAEPEQPRRMNTRPGGVPPRRW